MLIQWHKKKTRFVLSFRWISFFKCSPLKYRVKVVHDSDAGGSYLSPQTLWTCAHAAACLLVLSAFSSSSLWISASWCFHWRVVLPSTDSFEDFNFSLTKCSIWVIRSGFSTSLPSASTACCWGERECCRRRATVLPLLRTCALLIRRKSARRGIRSTALK